MEIAKIKPTHYVYNKKQMIGKGSFGEVFMGYNEKDHLPVAVKIVSFEKIALTMNKETLMSKLKQEIINMQIAKD